MPQAINNNPRVIVGKGTHHKNLSFIQKKMINIISSEADKLEKIYREENEIHEDYYVWKARRIEKILIDKIKII